MKDLKFQTAEQVMKHSNTDHNADFYTNMNKGFAMAINGFRISVQWGPGNYVSDTDIRYKASHDAPMQHSIWGCDTAEVMIWGRDGDCLFDLVPFDHDTEEYDKEMFEAQGGHTDQVFGHCSSDCVAKMIGCLNTTWNDEDPRRAIAQIYNANC